MEESIKWSSSAYRIFEDNNVHILRVGLHPSEGLLNGNDLLAGPFHQSYRELVLTQLWFDELKDVILPGKDQKVIITTSNKQINYAVGYQSKNKNYLQQHFREVVFRTDSELQNREFNVSYS